MAPYWEYKGVCRVDTTYKQIPTRTGGIQYQDGTTVDGPTKRRMLSKQKYRAIYCRRFKGVWHYVPHESAEKKEYLKLRMEWLGYYWQYDDVCYVPNKCNWIPTLTGDIRFADGTTHYTKTKLSAPLTVTQYRQKYCKLHKRLFVHSFCEDMLPKI